MKIKGFKDTIAWYDEHAEYYAKEAVKYPPYDLIDSFLELLPIHPRVLDAGCAAGRDPKVFSEKGASVVGIDISKGLIELAKKTHPEINFVMGDLIRLPFKDEIFDGIWAQASLVHMEKLEDVAQAFREFNRVLTPGGVVHVATRLQIGETKTAVSEDTFANHKRFFRYYTEDELVHFFTDNGFEVISLEHRGDPSKRENIKWIAVRGRKMKKK